MSIQLMNDNNPIRAHGIVTFVDQPMEGMEMGIRIDPMEELSKDVTKTENPTTGGFVKEELSEDESGGKKKNLCVFHGHPESDRRTPAQVSFYS